MLRNLSAGCHWRQLNPLPDVVGCEWAKLLHCVRTVCICRGTHPRSPATYLIAPQSSKANKIATKYLRTNHSVL